MTSDLSSLKRKEEEKKEKKRENKNKEGKSKKRKNISSEVSILTLITVVPFLISIVRVPMGYKWFPYLAFITMYVNVFNFLSLL